MSQKQTLNEARFGGAMGQRRLDQLIALVRLYK